MKILSSVTEPTKGEVKIRGRVGSLLEVGTGFHPELTGRENIFLNGAILGMTHREVQCKFDEIVAFAEIERFIDTPLKWYSTGMGTRLAFAIAAHLDTEILLVDEVLAVGDVGFRKKCLGKMKDVTQEGRTIIFVSHDRHFVEKTATAILELRHDEFSFFEGDYRDFLAKKGTDHLDRNIIPATKISTIDEKTNEKRVKPNTQERRQFSKELSRLEGKAAKREEDILSIETEIAEIDILFAGSEIYLPGRQDEFQRLFSRQKELKMRVHEEMILWENDQDRIAVLNRLISEMDNGKTS